MDAGVSELEFATLRSLRSASASALANDSDSESVTEIRLLRSKHLNSQDTDTQSAQVETGEDGIPREVLVAPPMCASNLPLDAASHIHLQNLIKQSIENVGLKDRSWEQLLTPLPTEILALIDDQLIRQISQTRRVLAEAEIQYESARAELKEHEGKSAKPAKETKDAKPVQDSKSAASTEKGKSREVSAQLDVNEIARHLLLEDLTSDQTSVEGQHSEKRETASEVQGLPKMTRFLICVSEDVSSNRRVNFESGVFSGAPLFQDEEDEPEKSIINEEMYLYVGGTIHLKAPEREWNRIEKILALVVYAACHLKLEVHLLLDSGCARPPPLPEKEVSPQKAASPKRQINREASDVTVRPDSFAPASPEPASPPQLSPGVLTPVSTTSSTSSEQKEPETKGHSKKWSRSGLVNLFFRDRTPVEPINKLKKKFTGKLKMHRTRSIQRRSEDIARRFEPLSPREEQLPMPGAFTMDEWEMVAPEKKVVVNMARVEEEEAGEILTAPASPTSFKTPSLPASPNNSLGKALTKEKSEKEENKPNERFKRVIERMQKAILSVSPDVHFPPPALLRILREQELQQKSTEGTRIPGRPLLGRLHSYAGLNSPTASPVLSDGLPTSTSMPALLSSSEGLPLAEPVLATKISIDTRAGLASLMTGNNSLDGTFRHQAIACLFERLVSDAKSQNSLCQPPLWRKLVYYHFEHSTNPWNLQLGSASAASVDIGDVSLSQMCEVLSRMYDLPCSANCNKPGSEHTFTLIHSDRKINIALKGSLLASTQPDSMLHWAVCSICGKRSDNVTMSDASLAISFGKYIELLLYDNAFHLPKAEFCSHSEDPFSLVRTFLRNGKEVRIKQESVSLYTLRMPTAVDTSSAQNLNEQVHLDHDLEIKKATLQAEIKAFFASLRQNRLQVSDPFLAGNDDLKGEVEKLLEQLDIAETDSLEEDLVHSAGQAGIIDINDVRYRLLQACARYTTIFDSFSAAQSASASEKAQRCQLATPTYATQNDMHVLPASNSVILRENELSSFIAFTLTAKPYQAIFTTSTEAPSSSESGEAASRMADATTPTVSGKTVDKLEEAKESDWALSAKVKKTVKPTGSILSLKATTPRAKLQDIFGMSEASRLSRQPSPLGAVPSDAKVDEDDKALEALLSANKASVTKPPPLGPSKGPALPSLISSLTSRRHVSEATATSAVSDTTAAPSLADLDINVQHGRAASVRSVSTVDSDVSEASQKSDSSAHTLREQDVPKEAAREPAALQPPAAAKGSTFSTISGFLHRGLRIGNLDLGEPAASAQTPSAGPHVKLTFVHGHKKMSCIVYYAKEFASLRKACGLPEALYSQSLERSHALQFSGGKTNAGFWITEDARLVLKEMRTSWNVSEVDAMSTFAPNYLTYLMTSNKPSLLTKIFGMYSCKVKNLKTGEKQKVDFVVMEHLFFDQQVTTKFDLKGISSRVARAKGEGQTLWDADWVENFQTRLLVHAYHKNILREAIAADTEFLQQNNVMDYSALVGVDDKNHTLTIGLIDTLGVFNLAKAIESNSKRVLQAERTIVPPDEYAARFQKALNDYIIASPEKWSRSPGDDITPALHCPL